MHLNLAIKFDELDADFSGFGAATKECSRCDPDSPLNVPRSTCPVCKGTGLEPLAILDVIEELRNSKNEEDNPRENQADEDYLEY